MILGSGNIGTDLMYKLQRSPPLELLAVVGIDPGSDGLARASAAGYEASHGGVEWILENAPADAFVFEATSAGAHRANAPRLRKAGLQSIDLTPAKLGPGVVPVVNLDSHWQAPDVNMITCGGQATIPMVAAVTEVCPVSYAEIVATIASGSAGPGTRQSIDSFTRTTAAGLEEIGGAERGKAIIVLNPADPPLMMRDTVFCEIPENADHEAIAASVERMRERVAEYVLGYQTVGFLMMAHMNTPAGLVEQAKIMASAGAQVVYVTDSAGALLPETARARVEALRNGLPDEVEVGFHGHQNLSLAVGNSLAAVRAGATWIDGCLCGMGAGAGNAALEALVACFERAGIQPGLTPSLSSMRLRTSCARSCRGRCRSTATRSCSATPASTPPFSCTPSGRRSALVSRPRRSWSRWVGARPSVARRT